MVAYDSCLLYSKIQVDQIEAGTYDKPHAIVAFLAMRNRRLLPAAKHKPGDVVKLRVIPLKDAPEELRSMQRSDDTEDYELTPLLVMEELP